VENQETSGGIACKICLDVRNEEAGEKVWICEWIESALSANWQARKTLHHISDQISVLVSFHAPHSNNWTYLISSFALLLIPSLFVPNLSI